MPVLFQGTSEAFDLLLLDEEKGSLNNSLTFEANGNFIESLDSHNFEGQKVINDQYLSIEVVGVHRVCLFVFHKLVSFLFKSKHTTIILNITYSSMLFLGQVNVK